MSSTERLSKRIAVLERVSKKPDVLTIEKRPGIELWRWGSLIVKMLRGVSADDL
jgi:hypothetical protein